MPNLIKKSLTVSTPGPPVPTALHCTVDSNGRCGPFLFWPLCSSQLLSLIKMHAWKKALNCRSRVAHSQWHFYLQIKWWMIIRIRDEYKWFTHCMDKIMNKNRKKKTKFSIFLQILTYKRILSVPILIRGDYTSFLPPQDYFSSNNLLQFCFLQLQEFI